MMAEYKAQLVAVQAKLAKDPDNEELLSLKADLQELIELSCEMEQEEEEEKAQYSKNNRYQQDSTIDPLLGGYGKSRASSSSTTNEPQKSSAPELDDSIKNKLVNNKHDSKRTISETELLARKKEKNRKKKAKLREKIKEQLDIAESEKQSWQSFANKKGLKGVNKKSIFASPCSLTGKVGVGTNGIADAPSATAANQQQQQQVTKRKY